MTCAHMLLPTTRCHMRCTFLTCALLAAENMSIRVAFIGPVPTLQPRSQGHMNDIWICQMLPDGLVRLTASIDNQKSIPILAARALQDFRLSGTKNCENQERQQCLQGVLCTDSSRHARFLRCEYAHYLNYFILASPELSQRLVDFTAVLVNLLEATCCVGDSKISL